MKLFAASLGLLLACPALAITIAGKPILRSVDLSPQALLVIDAISNGASWLDWALRTNQAYEFDSEKDLLTAIQTGLHGNSLVLISGLGLQVHPARLLDLGAADLRALVEVNGAADEARAREILTRYGWATQRDFAVVPQALDSLGVRNAPLFQTLTLADQLELLRVIAASATVDRSLQTEAAVYAVRMAKSPLEYCDLFRMYLAMASTSGGDAASRARQVRAAQAAAIDATFGMLAGPYLPEAPTAASVSAALQEWLAAGKPLGFTRLSLGLWQGSMAGLDALQAAVKSVLTAAPTPVVITPQTGEEQFFEFRAAGKVVTVRVDAIGAVTLARVQ